MKEYSHNYFNRLWEAGSPKTKETRQRPVVGFEKAIWKDTGKTLKLLNSLCITELLDKAKLDTQKTTPLASMQTNLQA